MGTPQNSGEEPVPEDGQHGFMAGISHQAPYKDNFKDVLHLVEIVLVLPISAAQCKQVVSAQNRIKSSVCAMLATSVVEDLILLSSEDPPVANFDAAPCVDRLVCA